MPLQGLLLRVHQKSSALMPVTLSNQPMNRRRETGPMSTPELSRELRRGVVSRSWQPKHGSHVQALTVQLLATLMKECVVMEESRWWTVLLMCCGRMMMLITTAAQVTWLTSTSLLRPSYRKMVSAALCRLSTLWFISVVSWYCGIIVTMPVAF